MVQTIHSAKITWGKIRTSGMKRQARRVPIATTKVQKALLRRQYWGANNVKSKMTPKAAQRESPKRSTVKIPVINIAKLQVRIPKRTTEPLLTQT